MHSLLAISNHGIMLGGGEHSFFDLIVHLPQNTHVISTIPCEGKLGAKLRAKSIEVHILPLPSLRPWLLPNIANSLKKYFCVCKKWRPAMIYANGSRAALYGGLVGRFLKIPLIWHCRIAEPDIYLDRLLVWLSTRIIANSQATAERFREHCRTKIRVVYNGIDIKWLRDRSIKKPHMVRDDWKVILVVGRASSRKRHDVVLSAFERIAGSDPRANLVCIGSRDEAEPRWWKFLQERTWSSSFSTRIHWVGHVEDIRPWYRAADMLVLGSENESFGRVVVEAMACGVPVVATHGGGIPEIVRHDLDGLLVPPGKIEEMAEAMVKILKDKPLRERLISSAHQRANFFSLDAHVANIVRIFEDAIRE